jgi:hypothetical protein
MGDIVKGPFPLVVRGKKSCRVVAETLSFKLHCLQDIRGKKADETHDMWERALPSDL